jgi:hypothetical protein
MCIVSGPPPNTPHNKNLELAHKRFKNMVPRHETLKIGCIRFAPSEVTSRIRCKSAFEGKQSDHMIFSKEDKTGVARKSFAFLKGADSFFNEWPVATLPFHQLATCSTATHNAIFGDSAPAEDDSNNGAVIGEMLADEESLKADVLIPWPQEHQAQF